MIALPYTIYDNSNVAVAARVRLLSGFSAGVPRHRHRDLGGEGCRRRRRGRRPRSDDVRAVGFASARALVGAESCGLVGSDKRRRQRPAAGAAFRRPRSGPLGPDARCNTARLQGARASPAILWNDGRSGRECAELERDCPETASITGNRAMPGFTAPKVAWVRRHEPDVFAEIDKVLLPKDYVRLRMTGDFASDMSDSAGTLWLDVGQRRWSGRMLGATGLRESQMPALFEGNQLTGQLRAEIAEAWGMPRVPVAAGGGDNAAGAIGVGVVRPGDSFLSLGTSGVMFLASDRYQPNPARGVHTFCHAIPKHWHQMSVILSAASCLDWAARLCGLPDAGALLERTSARNRPAQREMFLP